MTDRACLPLLAATMIASASCSSTGAPSNAASYGDPLTWSVKTTGPFGCGHRVLETSYVPPGGLPAPAREQRGGEEGAEHRKQEEQGLCCASATPDLSLGTL